jgi:uncharacterized RDD family membrane protein YckC
MGSSSKVRTHYDNLQVAENASAEVIRGAYKYLAQKWHPDRNLDNPSEAARVMKIITDAYTVLSNPESRREHDEWIKAQKFTSKIDEREEKRFKQPEEPKEDVPPSSPPSIGTVFKNFTLGRHHALRRWAARLFDFLLVGALFNLVFTMPTLAEPGDSQFTLTDGLDLMLYNWVLLVIIAPLEAAFISVHSTTPGKYIFGIKVVNRDGSEPSFETALKRYFTLWVYGYGLNLLLIEQVMQIKSYVKVEKGEKTVWDTRLRTHVNNCEWGIERFILAPLALFLVIFINAYVSEARSTPNDEGAVNTQNRHAAAGKFILTNHCTQSVGVMVYYLNLQGVWKAEPGGVAPPNDTLILANEENIPLLTHNSTWYYFAVTTNEPTLLWKGEHSIDAGQVKMPMIKMESQEKDKEWSINCEA